MTIEIKQRDTGRIIVPKNFRLEHPEALYFAFLLYDNPNGQNYPTSYVVRIGQNDQKDRRSKFEEELKGAGFHDINQKEYSMIIDFYDGFNSKIDKPLYYLIGGKYAAVAATLTHNQLHTINLENDEIIKEVKEKIETKELVGVQLVRDTFADLVSDAERDLFIQSWIDARFRRSNLQEPRTLNDYVHGMVSDGKLSECMRERYRSVK